MSSDFWDTWNELADLDVEVSERINSWDDTPSITRDAMTQSDWNASSEIHYERGNRYIYLAQHLGSWGS